MPEDKPSEKEQGHESEACDLNPGQLKEFFDRAHKGHRKRAEQTDQPGEGPHPVQEITAHGSGHEDDRNEENSHDGYDLHNGTLQEQGVVVDEDIGDQKADQGQLEGFETGLQRPGSGNGSGTVSRNADRRGDSGQDGDRKSTRLNSSHYS